MMSAKVASEDKEGQFGVPQVMQTAGSVQGRMDTQHPHHPIINSELNYHKNKEEAEMDMLRRSFGLAFPLKLQMERKAATKVGHLPCITTTCRPSLDALLGSDATIGFDDTLGQPEDFESLPALPFNIIDKYNF